MMPLARPSSRASDTSAAQQHLLLLHHARKCPHDCEDGDSPCPVYPEHCAATKRLWKHIAKCQNKRGCNSECYSARRVLTHFRECRDGQCPICGPVREVIRSGRERSQREQEEEHLRRIIPAVTKADTFSTGMTTRDTSAPQSQGAVDPARPQHDKDEDRPPSHHKSTIDEWVATRRLHLLTIDGTRGGGGSRYPAAPRSTSSVSSLSHSWGARRDGMRGGGGSRYPAAPRSASSVSSLSHSWGTRSGSYARSSSTRSGGARSGSARGRIGGGGGGVEEVYCIECRRMGNVGGGMGFRVGAGCNSGIRCKNNLGIAHFATMEESSQK